LWQGWPTPDAGPSGCLGGGGPTLASPVVGSALLGLDLADWWPTLGWAGLLPFGGSWD